MADFRTAFLTLPDEAFFELVRNYLGPIKTPFNKHDLIGKMETFLRQPETQERIVQLIDQEDAEVLSAVWLLGEPAVEEIFDFFSGRHSYMDTHNRLLNLEDRLLVFRDEGTLRINPILRPVLEQEVLSSSLLFRSRTVQSEEQPARSAWISDTLLVSFLSFFLDEPEFFRADGQLRKRVANQLSHLIPELVEPALPESETPGTRAGALLRALAGLGLVDAAAGTIAPPEAWEPFSAATPLSRVALVVAGWAVAARDHSAAASARTIADIAETVAAVVSKLPADYAVDPETVERLIASLLPGGTAPVRRIREAIALFGLMLPLADGYLMAAPLPTEHESSVPLIVQPNFELTVPQELPFASGLLIGRIARLTQHDRYPRFELTKDRLASALREGMELPKILERLREMSRDTIPQNVTVTLQSWTSEYESIRLFKGVVLTIEESRRFIVKQAAVARAIQRELAPGVYLISEADIAGVQEALAETGVELVPELATPTTLGEPALPALRERVDYSRLEGFARLLQTDSERTLSQGDGGELVESLHNALEATAVTSEQRQELAARVDRKLILSPEQLRPEALKSEKTEARGLDYVGKVRIIEQAVRSGNSFLEVVERAEDGSPVRHLLEPGELQKESDELYLLAYELPDRSEIRLRVRKLGLVRRIRGGLLSRRPGNR